mmetsp:Transcript_44128/g.76207  ORF Transcript_44128/g.76207 Transcript_44128/m.76207 type:complete len:238 (-) Transcript_44128:348-1061(-)
MQSHAQQVSVLTHPSAALCFWELFLLGCCENHEELEQILVGSMMKIQRGVRTVAAHAPPGLGLHWRCQGGQGRQRKEAVVQQPQQFVPVQKLNVATLSTPACCMIVVFSYEPPLPRHLVVPDGLLLCQVAALAQQVHVGLLPPATMTAASADDGLCPDYCNCPHHQDCNTGPTRVLGEEATILPLRHPGFLVLPQWLLLPPLLPQSPQMPWRPQKKRKPLLLPGRRQGCQMETVAAE